MLDIATNRRARKWTPHEQLGRVIWCLVHPFFALSPQPLWGWRRGMLRLFGARIGRHVHVYPSARITIPWNIQIGDYSAIGDRVILYALGTIRIGREATISQGVHLCAGTHDYRSPFMTLLKAPITVGDGAWICADAFVGPGRAIGDRAIVGARAVVVRDVACGMVVGGNPARVIGVRERQ